MKNRFLIHELNHTVLLVEINKVELPTENYPAEGKHQDLPSLRLQSSSAAEGYFLKSGVDF